MTDKQPEPDLLKAAEEYSAEAFKLNPDGFHIAPWVNDETLSDAFLAGAAYAHANPRPEVLALEKALEDAIETIHGEFCSQQHHPLCIEPSEALSNWRKAQAV